MAKKGQAPDISWMGPLARPNVSYLLIVLFLITYVFTGHWVFGLLCGLSIFWAVALEFWLGASEHGFGNEIKETAIALLIALVVWFGAGFVLQTSSPLNAIVSCSMLPHIDRGDMVILQGGVLNAPEAEVGSIIGIGTATVYEDGSEVAIVQGSMYSYCAAAQRRETPLCREFISSPQKFTEKQGPLTFGYDRCDILYPKSNERQVGPCVAWLEVGGKKYYENLSNDVVVYTPNREEAYSRVGDIIHRAYIRLKTQQHEYFLTKGDNNPVFDVQVYDEASGMGNRPVEIERLKGRVIAKISYLGYLKLFISPSGIATPAGCDRYYAKYAPS